jgi:anti-sigma B factor antagonist
MTTDAARPRQRFSGDGWSLEAHEDGGPSGYTLRGEFDFAASAKPAALLPARGVRAAGGRFAVVSAAPAVTRPIALLGLADVMPVHPAREAVEISRRAA